MSNNAHIAEQKEVLFLPLFQSYLSYTEGCYSGIRTLDAPNLWTPLDSQEKVYYLYFIYISIF